MQDCVPVTQVNQNPVRVFRSFSTLVLVHSLLPDKMQVSRYELVSVEGGSGKERGGAAFYIRKKFDFSTRIFFTHCSVVL